MKRYAISDIHGCLRTFRCLLEDHLRLQREDNLYLLGDYIDRGPESKGVIDHILSLKEMGYKILTLRGNHEQMMLDTLRDPAEKYEMWSYNGGCETLKSFGLGEYGRYGIHAGLFNEKYIRFLEQLEYYFDIDGYYLVHAGIDFSSADPFNNKKSMLWGRGQVYDNEMPGDKRLVHGHTPVGVDITRSMLSERVINIDGGCVFEGIKGLGHLIALDLDALEIKAVPFMERSM
jgi:serine/threonine protein phosphatase 1